MIRKELPPRPETVGQRVQRRLASLREQAGPVSSQAREIMAAVTQALPEGEYRRAVELAFTRHAAELAKEDSRLRRKTAVFALKKAGWVALGAIGVSTVLQIPGSLDAITGAAAGLAASWKDKSPKKAMQERMQEDAKRYFPYLAEEALASTPGVEREQRIDEIVSLILYGQPREVVTKRTFLFFGGGE